MVYPVIVPSIFYQKDIVVQQALPHLVPLLTVTLTKRQSEDDDDTWSLAMAAGTCLALVAQVVGDGCVDLVLQFVNGNFTNQDPGS